MPLFYKKEEGEDIKIERKNIKIERSIVFPLRLRVFAAIFIVTLRCLEIVGELVEFFFEAFGEIGGTGKTHFKSHFGDITELFTQKLSTSFKSNITNKHCWR